MPTQKKSKRKTQHKRAISAYKRWRNKNPRASMKRQVQMFDTFVDSSELEEIL